MTVAAFAEWFGVDPQTVYRWIWSGHVRAVSLPSNRPNSRRRTWRIPASERDRLEQGSPAPEGVA